MEGPAGVLRQMDHRLPAVQPLVRERRDGTPVHGIAGGADHRGGDPGARHELHEREGPPARGRGAEKGGSRSVGVSRGGRNTKVRVVSDSGSTLVEIHPGPGNEHDAAHERAAHGSARRVDALILPVTAVAGRLASGQVSRRDGDSFATVNVKLGASDGTSIIILDGLEEGDMVSATAPNLTLGAQS